MHRIAVYSPDHHTLHAWKTEGRLYHQPKEAEECLIYSGFVEGLITIEVCDKPTHYFMFLAYLLTVSSFR